MRSRTEASSPAGWKGWVVYTEEGTQIRTVWRLCLPLLVGSVLYFGAYAAGPALIRGLLGTDVDGTTAIVGAIGTFLVIAAGVVLGTAVVLRLLSRLDRRGSAQEAFELSTAWARDFLGGILIGAVASVAAVATLAARGELTVAVGVYGAGVGSARLTAAVTAALLTFALANNVFEEVLFREIVLRQTARGVRSRGASVGAAAGVALIGSTVVFGAFHVFVHGIGGAITSGIGGVLFGVAYLVSGRLALPIGVHFGGTAFSAIVREEFGNGLTLPTVLYAELGTEPALSLGVELWSVRVLVGVGLLLCWVYLWNGRITVHERVYRAIGEGNVE